MSRSWWGKLAGRTKKPALYLLVLVLGIGGLTSVSGVNTLADVGEAPTPGGIITPGDKTDRTEMTSEKVIFDIKVEDENSPFYGGVYSGEWLGHYAHVTAEFEMTNTSSDSEEMEIAFPIPASYPYPDYFNPTDKSNQALNFEVFVNGEAVEFEYEGYKMETFKESAFGGIRFIATEEGGGETYDVLGIKFPATFAPETATEIAIEYDARLVFEPKSIYGTFGYIMETGSHWNGNIGSGEITFNFPYEITAAVFQSYNDVFELSADKLTWTFTDLEPDSSDNIEITYSPALLKIWNERNDPLEKVSASGGESIWFDGEDFPGGYSYGLYAGVESSPIYLLAGESSGLGDNEKGWVIGWSESQNPWVLFEFDAVYEVSGIDITPGVVVTGYDEGGVEKGFYDMIARPKKVRLTFSDGSSTEFGLGDSLNVAVPFEFDTVETSSVKVEVLSVYPDYDGESSYLGIARMDLNVGDKVEEASEHEEPEQEEAGGWAEKIASLRDWVKENPYIAAAAAVGGIASAAILTFAVIKLIAVIKLKKLS